MTYHEANETLTNTNAICIFEQDMGFPVSRHRTGGGDSNYGFENLGVVKGAALTVRTIATVGNYVRYPLPMPNTANIDTDIGVKGLHV